MRPVLVKELRELAPTVIPAGALLFGIGLAPSDPTAAQMSASATWGAAGGALVGAIQGWLDRRARGDAFLLHRPASAARIHGTRTAAGGLAAAGLALMFHIGIAAHHAFLPDEFRPNWNTLSHPLDPAEQVFFTAAPAPLATRVLVGFAAALALWSALRISVARPGVVRAGALALTLPPLLCLRLVSVDGPGASLALACAAAAVLSALAIADLAAGAEAAR